MVVKEIQRHTNYLSDTQNIEMYLFNCFLTCFGFASKASLTSHLRHKGCSDRFDPTSEGRWAEKGSQVDTCIKIYKKKTSRKKKCFVIYTKADTINYPFPSRDYNILFQRQQLLLCTHILGYFFLFSCFSKRFIFYNQLYALWGIFVFSQLEYFSIKLNIQSYQPQSSPHHAYTRRRRMIQIIIMNYLPYGGVIFNLEDLCYFFGGKY